MTALVRPPCTTSVTDGLCVFPCFAVLVSPVGGPHSLRGVGRGDGGGREQWRREKNAQVPPVVEAKRGGGRGGSGVDSSPRPAV